MSGPWARVGIGLVAGLAAAFPPLLAAATGSVSVRVPSNVPVPAIVPASEINGAIGPEMERLPVLLVPGWSDGPEELAPLRARFLGAGWGDEQLMSVAFADPVGSNINHADEIAAAVDSLKRRTGSAKVDIVAHSMGGLATRWFLQDGGAESTRRVVFMATPHRGTLLGWATLSPGGREMRPGSEFLLRLKAFRAVPEGVEGLTIRTETDMHIVPNSSALLEGLPNRDLCCPTHKGLLDDQATFDAITGFLER